jgi:hypothetical protein
MKDEIGTGVVKDIYGNEFKIYPYRFLGSVVTATIHVTEVPIGCVVRDFDTKILLGWVDNDFPFDDILNKLIEFKNSGKDNKKIHVKDNDTATIPIELNIENAEYMAIVREGTHIPIASVMLTATGMLKNWWIDKRFRGSQTLRQHEGILLKNTLENGYLPEKFIANKLDGLFTKVYNENVIANHARAKFGFNTYGPLKEKGGIYFYSGQKINQCIKRVNKLIEVGS